MATETVDINPMFSKSQISTFGNFQMEHPVVSLIADEEPIRITKIPLRFKMVLACHSKINPHCCAAICILKSSVYQAKTTKKIISSRQQT